MSLALDLIPHAADLLQPQVTRADILSEAVIRRSMSASYYALYLKTVAANFIHLQDARHSADYDLSYHISMDEAYQRLALAETALATWQKIKGSAEANIFILFWKNWDRDRA